MKQEKLSEDIRVRLDIIDVISDYIELRKAGQNYRGLCPFHSEKTPSFMVSPDKQIFHCFGCGVGGNLIQFVMKYENLSFQESLRVLAKKAGIDLRAYRFDAGGEELKEKLLAAHTVAGKIFGENLRASKKAHAYLLQRGISEETIDAFGLGYAVRDWHSLIDHLRRKGFSEKVILQSGLASSGDKGIYDTFRDRIMFPVCDIQGHIIAFGGRVMDDAQPKYLNSPESLLFKKGETLYGLNRAKEGIRQMGYALIAEGYFDVALCHHFGFANAVAPLGTALTPGHLQKLRRFTRKVVLVFDGDEAGKAAARRSLSVLLGNGFIPKVLLLPENEDPDSYLRKHGAAAFKALLERAKSAIEFILGTSQKEKIEAIYDAVDVLSGIKDSIVQEELISELSQRTNKSETIIKEALRKRVRKAQERQKDDKSPTPLSRSLLYDEEVLILSAVLAFPEKAGQVLDQVPLEDFGNLTVRNILKTFVGEEVAGRLDILVSSLRDDEKELVTRLTVDYGFDHEAVDKSIEDCVRKILQRKSRERVRQVQEQIKQAETIGKHDLLQALLREREKLIREAR